MSASSGGIALRITLDLVGVGHPAVQVDHFEPGRAVSAWPTSTVAIEHMTNSSTLRSNLFGDHDELLSELSTV